MSKCCLHFLNFNLSSPSGIATCTALHAICRFLRQYCSLRSNSDKYTFVCIFRTYLLFSERFLIKVKDCVMSQAHANIYVTFFESVTCSLLFQLFKVSSSFLHYAKADKLPHVKPKNPQNWMSIACVNQINSFLQLTKGSMIAFRAITKGYQTTLIKTKENFPHIYGNSEWSSCKVIYD
jgi:hypothetical protein